MGRPDMLHDLGKCTLLALLTVALPMAASAQDNGLVLYGAGSLREAMTDMAALFSRERGIAVRTEFGASGRMRERIEAGDKVDVFTSADIGHAAKLVADGKASVMAMFARNDLCLLAPASRLQAGSAGALDALLKDGFKIGVSPPKIDPLGDYTVQLFDIADKVKPGGGPTLRSRAVVIDNPPVRRRRRVATTPSTPCVPAASSSPSSTAQARRGWRSSTLRSAWSLFRPTLRSARNMAWP